MKLDLLTMSFWLIVKYIIFNIQTMIKIFFSIKSMTYNVKVAGKLFDDESVFPVERVVKVFGVRQVRNDRVVQAVKHLVSSLRRKTLYVGKSWRRPEETKKIVKVVIHLNSVAIFSLQLKLIAIHKVKKTLTKWQLSYFAHNLIIFTHLLLFISYSKKHVFGQILKIQH